jgi:cell division protease FtsH
MIAATNRPDVLDPALMRPGRFDRQIMLDLPDVRGREAILVVHAQRVTMSPTADLSIVARGTPMFSGAELEALINEAALIATLKDKEAIEQDDLEEARDKVRFGRQKKSRVMVEEDRRITAYHESGHALVAAKLRGEVEPVHKVTIIPRGMALGSTMQLPERDKYHHTRKELIGMLTVLYGGRVAEEIFCDDISGGAANDIQQATSLARSMVCSWGMSEALGPVALGEERSEVFLGDELIRAKNYSEATSEAIDREIRAMVESCYRRAKSIIESNKPEMERLTAALMRYETLNGKDVERLIAGVSVEELRPEPTPAPRRTTDDVTPTPADTKRADEHDGGFEGTSVPAPGPA